MLPIDKLRKADIFSGCAIGLLGLWIIYQAIKMPMKDSWGGVQNVWYVSPALFPLLVGGIIVLLGISLTIQAVRSIGLTGIVEALDWLKNLQLRFLRTEAMMRFHAIMVLLFSFVFLHIPRIDFFLSSILFLQAFISMFYSDDGSLLIKLLKAYLLGTFAMMLWFLLDIPTTFLPQIPYASDWLVIIFILVYGILVHRLTRNCSEMRKRYKIALILAFSVPMTIGCSFKYFLLVPMPTEGMMVTMLDAIFYWDF